LRDAQTRLDAAVRAAYGMTADADHSRFYSNSTRLRRQREAGEKITRPGLPLPPNDQKTFVTGIASDRG